MKKIQMYFIALACGLFLFNSCNSDDLSITQNAENELSAKKKESSVNGQGGLIINDEFANFAFHATVDTDGNVSGSWQSFASGQDVETHGTIDCLTFIDDNTVVLTGTITKVKKNDGQWPGAEIGNQIWFKVRDNGEGSKSSPDQFSDYYLSSAGCTNFNVGLNDITNGNIQVKNN